MKLLRRHEHLANGDKHSLGSKIEIYRFCIRDWKPFLLASRFVELTDLTKVLLQGRRFFRPFDLETTGLRRILHSFAGAITVFGLAVAVATYLYKDYFAGQPKNIVSTLNEAEGYYYTVRKLDEISDRAAEINVRLQPNFSEDTAFLANHPYTILNGRNV